MINMMFIEDYIIDLGNKFNLSVEDALNVFDELADELMREPTEKELESRMSEMVDAYRIA